MSQLDFWFFGGIWDIFILEAHTDILTLTCTAPTLTLPLQTLTLTLIQVALADWFEMIVFHQNKIVSMFVVLKWSSI